MQNDLPFSSQATSKWWKLHPMREEMDTTLRLYKLFCEPVSIEDKRKLLITSTREAKFDSQLRLSLSVWAPDSSTAVEVILASVFRQQPTVNYGHEMVEEWSHEVCPNQTLNSYVVDVSQMLLKMGSVYTLFNLPARPSDMQVNSAADEIGYQAPKLKTFTPLNLVNYKVGNEVLTWIMFYEPGFDSDGNAIHTWTEVDTTTITEWILPKGKEKDTPTQSMHGTHNFGFVPIVCGYNQYCGPLWGHSFIKNSAALDVRLFTQTSDLEYDRYLTSHPMLVAKSDEDLGMIEIDAAKYISMKPSESLDYLSINETSFKINLEQIKETRMAIARVLHIDPLAFVSDPSQINISGVARKLSFSIHQADTTTSIANRIEQYHSNLIKMAYVIMVGSTDVDDVCATYQKDFSISDIDTQVEYYARPEVQSIKSPTFHMTMQKRIAQALVGNSPEINDIIEKEIDSEFGQTEEDNQEMSDQEVMDHHAANPNDEFDIEESND